MKRANGFLFFAILLGLLALSPQLFANDRNSQIGLAYGLSVPDAVNTKSFNLMGAKGEAFATPQISLGGYFFNSDSRGEPSETQKFRYALIGVQIAYHMTGTNLGNSFLALRVGMSKLEANISPTIEGTFSPYHYGPVMGYDYYIFSSFSLGFEGSYLHVLPGRTTVNGAAYDFPSFNIINFLVTLQYRM